MTAAPSIPSLDAVEAIVRRELSGVEGVEGFLVGRSGANYLRVYVVVEEHSRDLRERLEIAEGRLIEELRGFTVDIGVRAHQRRTSPQSLAPGCRYVALT